MHEKNAEPNNAREKQTWRDKATYVKKNWQLYLFFLMPGLLLTIIFEVSSYGGTSDCV